MQHWQKDRMKLVATLILLAISVLLFMYNTLKILCPLAFLIASVYWGYRWSKGNISYKKP